MTGTVVNSETIGKWVKSQRKKRGLSIKDLATMAGVAKSSIGRMEKHNLSPNMYTVEQVLKALGKRLVIVDGGTGTDNG